MFPANQYLEQKLDKRKVDGALRHLTFSRDIIDFCSNDYLGFARSRELKQKINNIDYPDSSPAVGSTGSRLLTGNSRFAEELEAFIADYHNAEAGLIYNSGYDANTGLFSAIPRKGDTILYDELIHASIRDGSRLSLADSFSFKHNDLQQLEDKLKKVTGNVFVAVESIYSMDGDFAPLKEMSGLCNRFNAHLIIDEAHATGTTGKKGEGRVAELGLENYVFARIHTFGKALGCHGAIVLGSDLLREYLINFSRQFIYTTALPFHSLFCVKNAYDKLSLSDDKILKLSNLVQTFKVKINDVSKIEIIESLTPIQCIILGGNSRVKKLAGRIQDAGFDVRPIMSPTVSKGRERLRICLHAFNTEVEVNDLINVISKEIIL